MYRRRLIILIVMVSALLGAEARLTFTQGLRQKTGGRIVLKQSAALDLLVDGRKADVITKKPAEPDTINSVNRKAPIPAHERHHQKPEQVLKDSPLVSTPTSYTTTSGWRVRFYMGGSSRVEKENAQTAGRAFKKAFPDVPVYMHFMAPHWVCLAGDFLTRAEAEAFIRRAHSVPGVRSSSMSIVKSRVKVPVNY